MDANNNKNNDAPKKRGRPAKAAFGQTEKEKTARRGRPTIKSEDGKNTDLIKIRIPAAEKAAFQAEADRLGITLTDLLSIRIGATSGVTAAMSEIEKMRARIDKTAEEFSSVQPQITDVWFGMQEMRADIENYRMKDRTVALLSNRMTDVSMWRKELTDILERLEAVEKKLELPALAVAHQIERLADGLEMLMRAGG